MFERVFRTLADAGVRYVVAGGVAVVLQGHARLTLDLDLIVELEDENLERAMEAFEALGLQPLLPVSARDFADREIRRRWVEERNMLVFTLRDDRLRPPLVVDLFAREPMPFEDLWARADVLSAGGVDVHVASIDDLISMKQGTQRPRDLEDTVKLRAIARRRRGEN